MRALGHGDESWLAAMAFLHDMGELSQAKMWPDELRIRTRGHLEEGVAWPNGLARRPDALGGAAHALLRPSMEAGEAPAEAGLRALLAHHGRPAPLSGSRPFDAAPHYDRRAREALMGEAPRAWFPGAEPDPALLERPPPVHLFAGLLALAGWIGSDRDAFPLELAPDVPTH